MASLKALPHLPTAVTERKPVNNSSYLREQEGGFCLHPSPDSKPPETVGGIFTRLQTAPALIPRNVSEKPQSPQPVDFGAQKALLGLEILRCISSRASTGLQVSIYQTAEPSRIKWWQLLTWGSPRQQSQGLSAGSVLGSVTPVLNTTRCKH